jgi:membrane protease YdiL (CAAX protease family)
VSRDDAGVRKVVMTLAIVVEGGVAALALLLGWVVGWPPLATFAWDPLAALVAVAATVPLLASFFAFLRWPGGGLFGRLGLEVLCPLLAPCTVPDLAAISLLAGFGEEMLFRGTLQAWISQGAGPWVGLAAASLLFGLLHAVTPAYALMATLIGACLGGLWQATGNLLAPVVVHALFDFVALYYLIAGPGRALWERHANGEDSSTETGAGPEPPGGQGDYFAATGAANRYDRAGAPPGEKKSEGG